ncbi:hypothetical protein SDC9_193381 [bioreactor metagenome]|uniref:Uncharacterized protein n=1 Tax=bioreactor metagenome TaxID=1076179 RepID=A0A645I5Y7_9ZZZZ
MAWEESPIVYGTPFYIAGDVNLDDNIDETDVVTLNRVIGFFGRIDQKDPRNFIEY